MGNVGEEESAVSSRKDSEVKHDLLKCFRRSCKQYALLFSLCVVHCWKLRSLVASSSL